MKKIIFIASTGGHMSELLCLKKLIDKYDSYVVTEKTETTIDLKNTFGDKMFYVPYGTKAHLLKYIFIFTFNFIKSFYLFIKIRPDFVITTGAHTAVPMCLISKLFRKKIIFIETFANVYTRSLSGRMMYKIADLFIVQWEPMQELYPNAVYRGGIY